MPNEPAVSAADASKLRTLKYRMLVALDRPGRTGATVAGLDCRKIINPWRVTLGWLQAERDIC